MSSAHHWHDVHRGLLEAHRVLAPGGRLVLWERVATGTGVHAHHGFTLPQADGIAGHLDELGFTRVHVEVHRLRGHEYVSIGAVRGA
jgi:hypothetical protein